MGTKNWGTVLAVAMASLFCLERTEHPITVGEDFAFQNKAVLLSEASFAIPTDVQLKTATAKVELRRRSCDRIIDQATFPITTTGNRGAEQSSINGLFSVMYDKGQILITWVKNTSLRGRRLHALPLCGLLGLSGDVCLRLIRRQIGPQMRQISVEGRTYV